MWVPTALWDSLMTGELYFEFNITSVIASKEKPNPLYFTLSDGLAASAPIYVPDTVLDYPGSTFDDWKYPKQVVEYMIFADHAAKDTTISLASGCPEERCSDADSSIEMKQVKWSPESLPAQNIQIKVEAERFDTNSLPEITFTWRNAPEMAELAKDAMFQHAVAQKEAFYMNHLVGTSLDGGKSFPVLLRSKTHVHADLKSDQEYRFNSISNEHPLILDRFKVYENQHLRQLFGEPTYKIVSAICFPKYAKNADSTFGGRISDGMCTKRVVIDIENIFNKPHKTMGLVAFLENILNVNSIMVDF